MPENDAGTAGKAVQVLKTRTIRKTRKRNSNDPLSKEEVATLINNTTDLEVRTLFILGFNTGMRASEIINIPWVAVDWAEGCLTIWDEKKDKYRRVLPNRYSMKMLELWKNSHDGQEKIFDFTTKTLQNKLQKWATALLGKKKSWHCIRHTYITLNVIEGTPVSIVSENTGDSPATIYKYYTQIPPQKKREFVEKAAVYQE